MDSRDPRLILANRLRALRDERWAGVKVRQTQLAEALSGNGRRSVSVQLISSWESQKKPTIPPVSRLEDIATFFATRRSINGQPSRLLDIEALTDQELAARDQLAEELMQLRKNATAPRPGSADSDEANEIITSLRTGPWHFAAGRDITLICAQVPQDYLKDMAYADPLNPDHIAMYRYSDLDSLFELHGHVRAANPASQVTPRTAAELQPDDYTAHLGALGGVDWNEATRSVLDRLHLPVRQIGDWSGPEGAYFEVTEEDGRTVAHRPLLDQTGGRKILREDVALFARAVNPFNRKRTVSICNGMYGSGTFGAVRALTDARFRDRNAEYIRERFGDAEAYCILSRVTVENGHGLTPDWTESETRLFEWSRLQ